MNSYDSRSQSTDRDSIVTRCSREPRPAAGSHSGDLFVLGGLFDGCLLADDLLQPLQPDVLGAQVPHAGLTAMEQGQRVDVLQLRVAHALVHHQVEQLVRSVVQHLVVLPEWGGRRGHDSWGGGADSRGGE